MTTINDLMPRTTTGVIPVSEEYLTQFAEAIILECVKAVDKAHAEPGDAIIEHFGLR